MGNPKGKPTWRRIGEYETPPNPERSQQYFMWRTINWLESIGISSNRFRAAMVRLQNGFQSRKLLGELIASMFVGRLPDCQCKSLPHNATCFLMQRAWRESEAAKRWKVDRHGYFGKELRHSAPAEADQWITDHDPPLPVRSRSIKRFCANVMDWLDALALPSGPLRARMTEAGKKQHYRMIISRAYQLIAAFEAETTPARDTGLSVVEDWTRAKWQVDRSYQQARRHPQGDATESMVHPLPRRLPPKDATTTPSIPQEKSS